MNVFDDHDSFVDCAAVRSELLFEAGPRYVSPDVSIIIPTYRRPDLLMETLDSALQQDRDVTCEIVIVSNDEDSDRNYAIVDRLPTQPVHQLRMYANARNIGMFPNWNRGIELARGRWAKVLNDDDILHRDFLAIMMKKVDGNARIDGVVAGTGFIDRRSESVKPSSPKSPFRTVWRRISSRRFDRNGLARIHPRHLFFGNSLSNTLGFLFKRDLMLELGGFRAEDAPSSDYLLYARFAAQHRLFVLNDVLAYVGVGENESLKTETLIGFMTQGDRLRRDMAGRHVPASWLRMSPLIVATAVAETNRFWQGQLDPEMVGRALGMSLPMPSRTRLNLLRLLHRAI